MRENNLLSPGANVLIDGQWGSTGKGKLASFLADNSDVSFATCDFQPNAGHTTVIDGGEFVLHCIPGSFVNRDAVLYIAPAASFKVEQFFAELEMLSSYGVADRIFIHPHAGVVTEDDAETERDGMGGIASTMQGTGAALCRKIRRKAELAQDFIRLKPYIRDMTVDLGAAARGGKTILVETAQGFDLSLNHGQQYPFVTSRDVTPAGALSNVGLPPQLHSRTWASMRAFPIRVGHFRSPNGEILGRSGPYYADQKELTWEEVSREAGMEVMERTTVTKRVRRIFTWSTLQYQRFLSVCQPTDVFINFVNYVDNGMRNRGVSEAMTPKVRAFIQDIEHQAFGVLGKDAPVVRLLGTGPGHDHMLINEAAVPATSR